MSDTPNSFAPGLSTISDDLDIPEFLRREQVSDGARAPGASAAIEVNNEAKPTATIQEHRVTISSIVRDPVLMMRVKRDEATVKKYAGAMSDGAVFPPV